MECKCLVNQHYPLLLRVQEEKSLYVFTTVIVLKNICNLWLVESMNLEPLDAEAYHFMVQHKKINQGNKIQ